MIKKNSENDWDRYFKSYYRNMVGSFGKEDFVRNKRWFAGWLRFIEQYAPLKRGGNRVAIEIGCSIGAAASLMAERGFTVTATDISNYALKGARSHVPGVYFRKWNVEKPYIVKGKADIVYGFEVIEHVLRTQVALKNILDALKEGGTLILSTPFPYEYVKSDPTHISVKSPEEWKREFGLAGYRSIKLVEAFFIPLLYRYGSAFSRGFRGTVDCRYINSTLFIIAKK